MENVRDDGSSGRPLVLVKDLEKYDDFAKHARLMTDVHAKRGGAGMSCRAEASPLKKRAADKKKAAGKLARKKSLKRL